MSSTEFQYDVFLSHSSRDKDVVREIANRLKSDGVRVWFDEWEIRPGDSIPAKIEDGLEHSRVLVLCLSAEALAADWPQLESHTFRFKDPLNHNRRFIPLRLDDAPTKGSLAQFSYIDWRTEQRETEYPKLLEACCGDTTQSSDVAGESTAKTSLQLDIKTGIASFAFSPSGKRTLTGDNDNVVRLWNFESGDCLREFKGHEGNLLAVGTDLSGAVWSVAWSDDERIALSGSTDGTARLWDVESAECIRVLEGHKGIVHGVALHADQNRALTVSWDRTLRLWDLETEKCIRIFEGHPNNAKTVAWSIDGRHAMSGDPNGTIRYWDVDNGKCLNLLKGHSDQVRSLDWSGDDRHVLSGAMDDTVRLWDVKTGRCLRVFEGHTSDVTCVAWSGDQVLAVSGSADNTVRLWEVETGRCLAVLKGHESQVRGVAWSDDGSRAFSGDANGGIRVWDLSEFVGKARGEEVAESTSLSGPHQAQYTNAKVLLVGNSAAGKTGLSNRLALDTYKETDSTVGAWATQWKLPLPADVGPVPTGRDDDSPDDRPVGTGPTVEREVWLWDFGGQADQRLIHQLYMDQTQVAALVFDPQKQELLEGLGTWDRDLTRAATGDFPIQKLLVAGRIDAGGLRSVSRQQVEDFAAERGFARYIETSAKENIGCGELKDAICELIDWDQLTKRTTPTLFRRLKEEIVALKDEGRVLMRFNELRDALTLRLTQARSASKGSDDTAASEDSLAGASGLYERFTDAELKAVISLLAGPGVVWELGFGSWVLLHPELINSYSQAVIRTLLEDKRELGCITEARVLVGELSFPNGLRRLPEEDERIVLLAMHRILVENGLCLREPTKTGALLVFPSYARRERPDQIQHPSVLISYEFEGFLDDIYATLISGLHYTTPFDLDEQWNLAADFKSVSGHQLGVKLIRKSAGAAELLVYLDPDLPVGEMMIFAKYVHEHLLRKAKDRENVQRLRHWICKCGEPVKNRETAMERLVEQGSKARIICVKCEKYVSLWDEMEAAFADPKLLERVRRLEAETDRKLDSESKDRVLVGEVISTVGLAGQICREVLVGDHGIDMEIEFKDDDGHATGKKVYLQLKSGDSHLMLRKRDNAEIFRIKKLRHVTYWMEQEFPVLLVHRSSEGEIRWMEIRDHLKRITNNGEKRVRQIEFDGKRFDVMSVRRWRDEALRQQ